MAQLFRPSSNYVSKASLLAVVVLLPLLGGAGLAFMRSGYVTGAGDARAQPIQFSHKHHAGELGIDCLYCHSSVDKAASAGIPPTKTCMNCHSQIWLSSPFLEPVRASFRTDTSLQWTRLHDLPDFVYFNHSVHVNNGVACVSCHGRVDQMNLMFQENSLQMEWCLACHRAPENFVRPREHVTSMTWTPEHGHDQQDIGRDLIKTYKIDVARLANCSTCHR